MCVGPFPKRFSVPIPTHWYNMNGKGIGQKKSTHADISEWGSVQSRMEISAGVSPIRTGSFHPIRHPRCTIYGKGTGQKKSTHHEISEGIRVRQLAENS